MTPTQEQEIFDGTDKLLLELREIENIGATRASEINVELSSLLGSVSEMVSNRENAWNVKHWKILQKQEVANKAAVEAKATEEYRDFKRAERYEKFIGKAQRSIENYLRRTRDNEWANR